MKAGVWGTFLISWSRTEIDGLEAAPVTSIAVGAAWSWRGDVVEINSVCDLPPTDLETRPDLLRKCVAQRVHRLVSAAVDAPATKPCKRDSDGMPLVDDVIVLTDGAQRYTATLIQIGNGAEPLLMFLDELPPRDTDFWIVHHTFGTCAQYGDGPDRSDAVCFTTATGDAAPQGSKLVEELRSVIWR